MRPLILALGLSLTALPALAQTDALDRLRMDSLRQQNLRAQEQSNVLRRNDADLRGAIADQQRRQTQSNLRALQLRAAPDPAPGLAATPRTPAAASPAPSDDNALRRLQDKELDAGNARLRAITPAP